MLIQQYVKYILYDIIHIFLYLVHCSILLLYNYIYSNKVLIKVCLKTTERSISLLIILIRYYHHISFFIVSNLPCKPIEVVIGIQSGQINSGNAIHGFVSITADTKKLGHGTHVPKGIFMQRCNTGDHLMPKIFKRWTRRKIELLNSMINKDN